MDYSKPPRSSGSRTLTLPPPRGRVPTPATQGAALAHPRLPSAPRRRGAEGAAPRGEAAFYRCLDLPLPDPSMPLDTLIAALPSLPPSLPTSLSHALSRPLSLERARTHATTHPRTHGKPDRRSLFGFFLFSRTRSHIQSISPRSSIAADFFSSPAPKDETSWDLTGTSTDPFFVPWIFESFFSSL
jgi:hypothetical protein